jgi:hypothetical protein
MKRFLLMAVLATLTAQPALATDPCDFNWEVDDAGRLWPHHVMEANCGIEDFEHTVTFVDGSVAVVERGLCPEGMATCLCPYNTAVVVSGLAPGDHAVSWRFCEVDMSLEVPQEYCHDCAFTVTVPTPAVVNPRLVGITAAGCGIETVSAVPEEPLDESQTWGSIKSLYR